MDFILCLLSICLLEHVPCLGLVLVLLLFLGISPSCHSKGLNQVGEHASEDPRGI